MVELVIPMTFPNGEAASLNDCMSNGFMPFPQSNVLLPEVDDYQHPIFPPELHLQLDILDDLNRNSVAFSPIEQNRIDTGAHQDQPLLNMAPDSSRVEQPIPNSKCKSNESSKTNVKESSEPSPRKQKINISYIDNNRKRQVSFCKRKNGAMKKGRELVCATIFLFLSNETRR